MIAKPRLLLADEPTGALDSSSGRQVMEIFGQLNAAGTTVVLITHAQEIADCARPDPADSGRLPPSPKRERAPRRGKGGDASEKAAEI